MPSRELFSLRDKPQPNVFHYDELPTKFRTQLRWLWGKVWGQTLYFTLGEARDIICEEHGLNCLAMGACSASQDAEIFLDRKWTASDTLIALDLIELVSVFHLERDDKYDVFSSSMSDDEYVSTLNKRFRENGVGYQFNAKAKQLLRIDSEEIYENVTSPTLCLLADPKWHSANSEYLQACADFKKSDFADCIGKCGMAFESVMKIICDLRGWTFSQTDVASKLLTIISDKMTLEPYLREQLIQTATLRNKCAHGAGTLKRDVSADLASYALNVSASAILFLTEITQTR